jgi:regulatory protein
MTKRRATFAERRERRATVDDPAVVLEAALRFLEARSRSVTEVRRRLATAGYRSDLVEEAIARLTDLGMLDDEAFARAWVESRDRARPRGERALRSELALKGIERSVVEETIAERGGDDAGAVDRAAADRLLAKNLRGIERLADPRARRQRAYALLARNGFAPDICSAASAELVRGLSSVDEDDDADAAGSDA